MAARSRSLQAKAVAMEKRNPSWYNQAKTHPANPLYLGKRNGNFKMSPTAQKPTPLNFGNMKKFKKGGKVKKTGPAIVHKGERILNKKQTKRFDSKKYDNARKKAFGIKGVSGGGTKNY